MRRKRLTKFETFRVQDLTILNFHKINVENYNNTYREGDNFIIGFGTYYCADLFGQAALPHIWREYKAGNNVFAEVGGHFNFILHDEGVTKIVSDKTGYYHAFHSAEQGRFYVSSSLFAVAESLTELRLGKQEILEFINVQTVFGDKTIFTNIDHLKAGCIFEAGLRLKENVYYQPEDENVSFAAFAEKISAYFDVFKHTDHLVSCDLSGGYDTRTVGAICMGNDIDVVYNTNTNDADPNDHLVAQQIAQKAGAQIETQTKDLARYDYQSLIDHCFDEMEIARDVYFAAYSPVFFEEKSSGPDVIFGGYGGELYRDKYSADKSLRELIAKRYILPGIRFARGQRKVYADNLLQKFEKTLAGLGEKDTKKAMEKIYYWEKMRYWGGARISAFNQYCFRVHPLIDYALMKYVFDVPLSAKRGSEFQKQVISCFAQNIANIPFSNEIPADLNKTRSPRDIIKSVRRKVESLGKKIIPFMPSSIAAPIMKRARKLPSFLRDYRSLPDHGLEDFLNLRRDDLASDLAIGRFLTIAKTIGKFREKIS